MISLDSSRLDWCFFVVVAVDVADVCVVVGGCVHVTEGVPTGRGVVSSLLGASTKSGIDRQSPMKTGNSRLICSQPR